MRKSGLSIAFVCLATFLSAHVHAQDIRSRATVGAYYFDGWSGKTDTTHLTKDRRKNNCRISQGDSPIFAARKSGQSPTCSFAGPKLLKTEFADRMAKMQDFLKSGNEKLMKLLTKEQKTWWKELIGEPFKGELNSAQGGAADTPGQPPASGQSAIRFSIGNLSVPLLLQAWDSPMLKKLPANVGAAHVLQRSSFMRHCIAALLPSLMGIQIAHT